MIKRKNNLHGNKKANLLDPTEALKGFLLLILIGFLSFTINIALEEKLETVPSLNVSVGNTTIKDIPGNINDKVYPAYDKAILLLFILLPIFSIYAAIKIPVTKESTFFLFLILLALILLSFVFSNVIGKMQENATFNTFINHEYFPFINFIIPKLPYYFMIYSFLVIIFFYSKGEFRT